MNIFTIKKNHLIEFFIDFDKKEFFKFYCLMNFWYLSINLYSKDFIPIKYYHE